MKLNEVVKQVTDEKEIEKLNYLVHWFNDYYSGGDINKYIFNLVTDYVEYFVNKYGRQFIEDIKNCDELKLIKKDYNKNMKILGDKL